MSKVSVEAIYPLAPMQQGMLFHTLYAPASGVYVVQVCCSLRGPLKIAAFRRAWQRVIERHAILRTAFLWEHRDKPLQVAHQQVRLPFRSHDWRDADQIEQARRLDALLQADRAQGFLLVKAPLLRLTLIQTAADDYHFIWSFHHLLLDGWSIELVLKEVFLLYSAFCRDQDVALASAGSYRDYITWLQQQDIAEAERFWRQTLAGVNAPTPLGVAAPPTAQPNREASYAEQQLHIEERLTAGLLGLARQQHLTLNTIVQGAWALIVSRYSGEADVIFGATTAGRPPALSHGESIVGLCINTLPMRVQVASDGALVAWLQQLQLQQAEVRHYEYSPLVQIQQWSGLPHTMPLFESILVFENYPLDDTLRTVDGEVIIGQVRVFEQTNYPLTVVITPGARLSLRIIYACGRFDTATITRMLRHIQKVLEGMVADPTARVGDLALLMDAERQQLLIEWSGSQAASFPDICVHELFEAQVMCTPDAVAVSGPDPRPLTPDPWCLTYAELNARANRLAHELRRLGVGPESRVGICVERSPELVIGILSILKAGGAYVPLDPSYPAERLMFMLADADVRVLLTTTKDDGRRTMDHDLQSDTDIVYRLSSIVYLDADWPLIARQPATTPGTNVLPNNLAYVLYTSGSTGTPKGVAIAHRSAVGLLAWARAAFAPESLTGVLASTSISFDLSVFELFVPLSWGGTVILAENVLQLSRLPAASVVSLINTVPSALLELARMSAIPASVRTINLAGEPLPGQLAQDLYRQTSIRELFNLYGPTEATTYATWALVPDEPNVRPAIGHPIANTQTYVLDRRLLPVPIGVVGELYIGGECLARGYLNRPDLTAEHFVPNPFLKDEGRRLKAESDPFRLPPSAFRLYRTGDLVRYRPDGNLEFLGRIDHQVKLRGYRIELGEIEAVLGSHDAVQECVVLVRKDARDEKRLVAYVVPHQGSESEDKQTNGRGTIYRALPTSDPRPLIPDLRTFLADRLPGYMIPSAFVVLDALPLTPNGKIDRRALPAPDQGVSEPMSIMAAPSFVEDLLADIWCDALRLEWVGAHDDFFDLGGHSLLAMQVISRVRDAFKVELSLQSIFETPTLAGLAERIRAALRAEQPMLLPPIRAIAQQGAFPLSFAQQRLWFLDQLAPGMTAYIMPASLRLSGPLDVAALERSLGAVIERHAILRTTFALLDDQPIQVIAPASVYTAQGAPLLMTLDLQALPEAAQETALGRMAALDAMLPFDLTRGPLLRAHLLRLADTEHVLLVTMHHIIADAWSLGVFIGEVATCYGAATSGQSAQLPALPIQYADYAIWQRAWLQGEALEQLLAYWRAQLAELPVLQLPTDHPRPPVVSFHGAAHAFTLPADLSAALGILSRQAGVTLFMTLLAAFQTLLQRYSGQDDIVVSTGVASRNQSETEALIGCFINILVLRTDLCGNPSFRALLGRVKEVCLGAYVHQDLPFEVLVEQLQPERDLSYNPLAQVMFILQTASVEVTTFHDLTVRPAIFERAAAQFDLGLHIRERAGGLSGLAEYSTDLFDESTIVRMLEHFRVLLEGIVADSEQPIALLPLLTEAEQHQLMAWNETNHPYPHDCCLHHLAEAHASLAPDAIALIAAEGQLTYAELNQRANQLAHYLRLLGIGPEVQAGIYVERSAELVLGILGVLKAGGAYVPLDPSYPPDRLAFMLADAQVRVLLTTNLQDKETGRQGDKEIDPLLVSLSPCLDRVVDLRADWPLIARQPATAPDTAVLPDNPAYVIYTSGSTGWPKGIAITHRGVVNNLVDLNSCAAVGPRDRVLALSALSFDMSVYEVLGTLAAGAAIILTEAERSHDPRHWAELIGRQRVTVWNSAPPLLTLLCEYVAERSQLDLRSLRVAILGGDWVPLSLPEQLRTLAGDVEIITLGGATEASIHSTIYPLAQCDPRWTSIPYGRPMANQRAYVLDGCMQLAPVGVPGELHLGGIGLARGYFGRPELTAERFVPNPFLKDEGGRLKDETPGFSLPPSSFILYKTGDRARYRRDGVLELLGRMDFQVKIRGLRIELSEIQAVLEQHPQVRKSVVVVGDGVSGDKRLVAYVVPAETLNAERRTINGPEWSSSSFIVQRSALTGELRSFLQTKLPEYMLPTSFMLLEALPLSPNGKVNRRALPPPDQERSELEEGFVAPRNSLEERLAGIWADLLKREHVGINDRFFELGGHSLLAAQLIARIRDAFQIELPLRTIFEAPTVSSLAVLIAQRMGRKAEYAALTAPLPMIVPDPARRYAPFLLTDIQYAYWIGRSGAFELGNVSTHSYVELEATRLELERLTHAWRRLIDHYDMLRAIILPSGEQQVLAQVPPYRIAILDLRGLDRHSVEIQLNIVRRHMSHQVLPSDCWPLFEIRATRLDGDRTRLHISSDALILDAWSRQLLTQQLVRLYQEPNAQLPPCDLTFRDYVLAEAALAPTELYQRAVDYWRQRLSTLPPAPELPLAKNPDTIHQPHFVRRSAQLEPEIWRRLKRRASRSDLSPSGILLAAFAEVLATWSKSPAFTINLTLFNRLPMHPQVIDLVGDFTSLTLLAVAHDPTQPFVVRAQRLQHQLWDDLDHRAFSGVRVLRELARNQGGARRALMPVVFTSTLVQGAPDWEIAPTSVLGEVVYSISQTPQVWLDHQVVERAGMLRYSWDAVEELFPAGLLDDMFGAYEQLLRRLADVEMSWQTPLELVPPAQLALQAAINTTWAPLPSGQLHTLFAEQALERPAQAAVIATDRTLTYMELYRRANQVGRRLRQLGARPNMLVAVVLEKGWEQVVAVLGILCAGAAYLPIDPGVPQERLHMLLEEGAVTLALTQHRANEQLAWPSGVQRLIMEADAFAGEDDQPLAPLQYAEDLAYVIYTSGSTGSPKGVMIDHRSAVNTIVDINRRFGVGPDDRVLALSALGFDLSVYDIFGTLAAGGTIIIPPLWAQRDPASWNDLLQREQVTIWNSVPALMEMLVAYVMGRHESLPSSLRLVLLSGDWIPVTLPQQLKALSPAATIVSLGGATEASIWSIAYPIEMIEPGWTSIPYGKPMINQQFYVLNEALEPYPTWVPGQLYIGGIGLAHGYLHRPDLTAERFIPNPFAGDKQTSRQADKQIGDAVAPQSAICNLQSAIGTRLYKTGDLGRYLPDGNIEFLGREDFQVKVQGYRVELGEIEAALGQHPLVRQVVVAAQGELRGAKRLIAYIVPDRGPARDGAASRSNGSAAEVGRAKQLDPFALLEFKLSQPGIRQDQGRARTPLVAPASGEGGLLPYTQRRSHRAFLPQPLAQEQLGGLLGCLRQIELAGYPLPKYQYASAGSLYPVQTYLYVKAGQVAGLDGGTYYYHPREHTLIALTPGARLNHSIHAPINQAIFDASAFTIFLVGRMDAITPVYGELARDFCLLEAGSMCHLLMTAAPAQAIGLCMIGALHFDPLRDLLGLAEHDMLLHSLLGGRIDPAAPVQQTMVPAGPATSLVLPATDGAIISTLRQFLQEKLPQYMVPATFVLLDELPLSANGKVDRVALPSPDSSVADADVIYIAPQTEMEHAIAAIWQTVLQLEKVGLDDNFFDRGGTSIHMVQVHTRLHDLLQRDIPIVEMFNNPTVRSLATYLGQQQPEQSSFDDIRDRSRQQRIARERRERNRSRS